MRKAHRESQSWIEERIAIWPATAGADQEGAYRQVPIPPHDDIEATGPASIWDALTRRAAASAPQGKKNAPKMQCL